MNGASRRGRSRVHCGVFLSPEMLRERDGASLSEEMWPSEQGQSGSAFLSLHSSRETKEISRHNDVSSGQRFLIKPDPGVNVLYGMVPGTASDLQEVANKVAFLVFSVRFYHHGL